MVSLLFFSLLRLISFTKLPHKSTNLSHRYHSVKNFDDIFFLREKKKQDLCCVPIATSQTCNGHVFFFLIHFLHLLFVEGLHWVAINLVSLRVLWTTLGQTTSRGHIQSAVCPCLNCVRQVINKINVTFF